MTLRTAAILSLLATTLGSAVVLQGSSIFRWIGDQQGYRPVQPIAFSHKLHAGDFRVPCLYCHSEAERSTVAGIPPAATCMNCHGQVLPDSPEVRKIASAIAEGRPIEWVKVTDLPDHVVFDHSRHVVAGIACRSCHGPVETMERVYQFDPFTMGTCVTCHRTHREVTLDDQGRPRISHEPTEARLMASTDCSVCHY